MKLNALSLVVLCSVMVVGCAPAAAPVDTAEGQSSDGGVPLQATIDSLSYGGSGYEEEAATEEALEAGEAYDEYAEATEAFAEAPEQQVPQPTPVDMFFEDYGTNPFVDASQDNLSTFAVDVDSGSYTLMRSYLNEGVLPPPEQVRLEEFVNYFEQDYPIPQDQAFGLHMEAAHNPFSAEEAFVMRVGVQGYEVAADQRQDATLIFVIDVSGSMDMDNRLYTVKDALNTLVNQLRPTDRIGIVVYGDRGRVVLPPMEIGQAETIRGAINSLYPEGATNAEEGLRLGYEMATEHFDPNRINKIILCSDGVANVGQTGPEAILETVRQQANEGITLTTVGFGMDNYNDVLMEQLANDGDGQYYYVDTRDEAERIFVEGLTGTLLTIALNAKIQVEFNPETVQAYRLMGYENRDVADDDFRNDEVDAGEIGAGHSVTALYEVVPHRQAQGVIATVHLRWEDPDTHEVTEIEQSLDLSALRAFEQASPRFQFDMAVAAFADLLGNGGWSQNTTLEEVLSVATAAAEKLGQDQDVQEFLELVSFAEALQN